MLTRTTQTAQRINLYVTAYQAALEQIPAQQRREKPNYSLRIHASVRRQINAGETDSNRIACAAVKDVLGPDAH